MTFSPQPRNGSATLAAGRAQPYVRFHVEVGHPSIGPVASYRGWLAQSTA